jgi:hypothetical protein
MVYGGGQSIELEPGNCVARIHGGCKGLFCAQELTVVVFYTWIADILENPLLTDCVDSGQQGYAFDCAAVEFECSGWGAYLMNA